jgi:CDP-diacylglycerol---glycerol-3-phosphate 3-phosphatidyltransferase
MRCNLANGLTLSRFVAAPVFIWLVLRLDAEGGAFYAVAAFVLLVVTLLTDMFDGMAARAMDEVTNFGKIMDPVADSTFFLSAVFALASTERFAAPIWLPLVVLYREVAMHVLRRYAALAGVVLAAKVSGKVKMVVQSVTLAALLAAVALSDLGWIALGETTLRRAVLGSLGLIALVNVLSFIEYLGEIPRLRASRQD